MKPYRSRSNRRRLAERAVEAFNFETPVGTECRFWTGVKEGPGRISKTRSPAQLLGGDIAVVWFEGLGPCVALSHVEAIMHEDKTAAAASPEASSDKQP